jgi:hypothetical protein
MLIGWKKNNNLQTHVFHEFSGQLTSTIAKTIPGEFMWQGNDGDCAAKL